MEKEPVVAPLTLHSRPLTILMADDDEDDCLLTRDALRDGAANVRLLCVRDGDELLDFLLQRREFAAPTWAPRPDLILLDLNMPRLNGHEALRQIKSHEALKPIPVVIVSTSNAPDDVWRSYADGANCYITKPANYDKLVQTMAELSHYWSSVVRLPPNFN